MRRRVWGFDCVTNLTSRNKAELDIEWEQRQLSASLSAPQFLSLCSRNVAALAAIYQWFCKIKANQREIGLDWVWGPHGGGRQSAHDSLKLCIFSFSTRAYLMRNEWEAQTTDNSAPALSHTPACDLFFSCLHICVLCKYDTNIHLLVHSACSRVNLCWLFNAE